MKRWILTCYLIGFGMLILFPISILKAQNAQSVNFQYKKIFTNAVAKISQDKPDEALIMLENFIRDFPGDGEAHYCISMAYSSLKDMSMSLKHVNLALDAGIPIERFVAGPRTLFKHLYLTNEFKDLVQKHVSNLIHGPMLGGVTATSAKIWVRTSKEAQVELDLIQEGHELASKFIGKSIRGNDYTCVIDLANLNPATNYKYNLIIDGISVFLDGSFKTLELPDQPVQLKIGFGGGAGYTPWFERMWDTLAVQSFDAFLLLGDNVYIDHPKLPDVQSYCYYRRQSRQEFRRFTPNVPIYAIWDDHDFTINDGEGGAQINEPKWKIPVWNLFKNQWANPYYGAGDEQPGCWFDFSMGDIDFIMLDCRYYRENPKEVDSPSMLGSYQKQWLFHKLKASTATFKFIVSSVPWAKNTKPGSDDTWDGFDKEREEIFSYIEENKIEGVLLLSADRHRSDAWKIARPGAYDLYDLMSSKLTNYHTHQIVEGNLFSYNKKCSFGTLEINTKVEDPYLKYSIMNIDNEEIHKMTIFKSQLRFQKEKMKNSKYKN